MGKIDEMNKYHADGLREALFHVRGARKSPSSEPRPVKSHWCDELETKTRELRLMFQKLPRLSKGGRRGSTAWKTYLRKSQEVSKREKILRKAFKKDRAKMYSHWRKVGDRRLFSVTKKLNNKSDDTRIDALLDDKGVLQTDQEIMKIYGIKEAINYLEQLGSVLT